MVHNHMSLGVSFPKAPMMVKKEEYGTLTNCDKSLHCALRRRSEDLAGPRCWLSAVRTHKPHNTECLLAGGTFQNSQTHVLLLPACSASSSLVARCASRWRCVVCGIRSRSATSTSTPRNFQQLYFTHASCWRRRRWWPRANMTICDKHEEN